MKVELPIIKPEDCELKAWCVQHFKVNLKKGRRRTGWDDKPYISMQCFGKECEIGKVTTPFSGTSIYQAYFEIPPNIEIIRKAFCVSEKRTVEKKK